MEDVPQSRGEWAKLMMDLGVKGVHIAERDTQRSS
jgi:homospermidine synthase